MTGSKRHVAIVSLVALLLSLVSGMAFAGELTPKQLFLAAQYKTMQRAQAEAKADYGTRQLVQERSMKEAYTQDMALRAGFNSAMQDPTIEQIKMFLKGSSLKVHAAYDPAIDKTMAKTNVVLRGEPFISVEAYQSADDMAMRLPEVLNRYLLLENKNLNQFFAEKGIPYEGADRFPTALEYQKAFYEPMMKLSGISKGYAAFLVQNLKTEEFMMRSNVTYASPEGDQKVTQVTLSLSEKRVQELLKGIGAKMAKDEAALDVLSELGESYIGLMAQQAPGMIEPMTKAQIKEQMSAGLTNWDAIVDQLQLPGGLTYSILVDDNLYIVKQELSFTLPNQPHNVQVAITSDRWDSKSGTRDESFNINVSDKGGNAVAILGTAQTVPNADGSRKITGQIGLEMMANETKQFAAAFEFNSLRNAAKDGMVKTTTDFNLAIPTMGAVKGTAVVDESSALVNERYQQNVSLQLAMLDEATQTQMFDLNLGIDSSISFKPNLTWPEFTKENSINLNQATQAELEELGQQLEAGVQKLMMEKMHLFAPLFLEP